MAHKGKKSSKVACISLLKKNLRCQKVVELIAFGWKRNDLKFKEIKNANQGITKGKFRGFLKKIWIPSNTIMI